MSKLYRDTSVDGFGKSKPLKRPVQARSKVTVQAIYDAFVRIWRSKGWEGVTTRAVALEAGVAVGTLYDFFSDKEALLSGYVRHCIETLLSRIDAEVIAPPALVWSERVDRLVSITCDPKLDGLPHFDYGMLMLEPRIAEPKHHRRVYDELRTKWRAAAAACCDLQPPPSDVTLDALLAAAWGGRRYRLLVEPDSDHAGWVAEMQSIVRMRLASPGSPKGWREWVR